MSALVLLCASAVAEQTSEKVYGGTAGEINNVVKKPITHAWDGYVGSAAGLSHDNGYIDAWDEEYCLTKISNSNFVPVDYITGLQGSSENYSTIELLGTVTSTTPETLNPVQNAISATIILELFPSTISYATHEFNFGPFAVPGGISVGAPVFITITVSNMDDFCRHSPPVIENVAVEVVSIPINTLACVLETLRLYVDGEYISPANGARSTLSAAPGSENSTITYIVNFTLLRTHGSTVNITASQGLTLSAYSAARFAKFSSLESNGCSNTSYHTSCCLSGMTNFSECPLWYQSPCDTASGIRVEHLFLSAATGTTAATPPATATTLPTLAADPPTSKSKDNSMDKVALGVIIGLSAIIVIGVGTVAFGPIKRCFHRSQTSQNNDSLLLG